MAHRRNPRHRLQPALGTAASEVAREAAQDVAREAAEEPEAGRIGAHLGARILEEGAEGEAQVAVHRFAAQVPGYPGWEWQAVVACAAGSNEPTVNEVCLVPAEDGPALQAPRWVPFSQRIRPGDLQPGMALPPAQDDPRLTRSARNSATAPSDGTRSQAARRRKYFLSRAGLDQAAARWRVGFGPESDFARDALLHCETCAFYLPLGEQLENFGVCANEFAADGRAVHARFGCGAHSQTPAGERETARWSAYDDERPLF